MQQDVNQAIQQAGARMRANDFVGAQQILAPHVQDNPTAQMLYNQAGQLAAAKQAQKAQAGGRLRLQLIVLGIVALAVGGFLLWAFVIDPYLKQQARDQTAAAFGAELAAACSEVPSGRGDNDNAPEGDARVLVLVGGDSRWHEWHSQVPEAARATSAEDTSVVICVEQTDEMVEQCDYQGGSTYTRYQREVTLVFLNAETGEIIERETLEGSEPGECPDTITTRNNSTSSQTTYGDFVTFEQFIEEVNGTLGLE